MTMLSMSSLSSVDRAAAQCSGGHGFDSRSCDTNHGAVIPDHGSLIPDHGSVIPDHGSVIPDHGSVIPDSGSVIRA